MMEEKEAVIPVDPSIATGALHNGLRYYVQHNSRPSRRVVLRLVVRVGSLHEEEHERGLAHFVEHMGFKATRSFGRGELVKYFESIGASFGADLNAHTGLDQTVYKISIPMSHQYGRQRPSNTSIAGGQGGDNSNRDTS